jgi:hypothetical protein
LDRLDCPEADRGTMDAAVNDVINISTTVAPLRRICVEYFDCVPSPFSGRTDVETHGRLDQHGFFLGEYSALVYESVLVR